MLAVAVWWTYFDRLDDNAVRALAKKGRSRPYLIWLYIHLPLTLAVTMLGVALGLILTRDGESGYASVAWLLSGALALYLLTEATICATGVGARQPTLALTWGVRSRLLAVPLILLVPLISRQPYWLLASSASLVWLIALGDWYLERRGHPQMELREPSEAS